MSFDESKSLSHSIERFTDVDVIGGFETEELVRIQLFEGGRLLTLEFSILSFQKVFGIAEAIANAVPTAGMIFCLTAPKENEKVIPLTRD